MDLNLSNVLFVLSLILLAGCVYRPLWELEDQRPGSSAHDISGEERAEINETEYQDGAADPVPVLPDFPEGNVREVRRAVEHYRRRDPRFIPAAIERAGSLFKVITDILKDEGLPREAISVAIVESGFKTQARSRSGALGLWQFMRSTARIYGLDTSSRHDQRKDPVLSTIAAARHLRDLYREYNDWLLALAAYNGGTGRVNGALRRHGTRDFWKLAQRGAFKRQTAQYVPKVLAVARVLQDPAGLGFPEVEDRLRASQLAFSSRRRDG